MEQRTKKENIFITTSIIIVTIICVLFIEFIIYIAVKNNSREMTIVFYDVEYITETTATNMDQEYVCAYVRLNSDNNNYWLNVGDFSIFCSSEKWKSATKVEYFHEIIDTTFQTYPNQPILKIYFNVSHSAPGSVVFIKYQDTQMRIGEFAKVR